MCVLEALFVFGVFAGLLALAGAYRALRTRSLRGLSLKHGYVYREKDREAALRAGPLVGAGEFSEFVTGERGRKFVFCLWKWSAGGFTDIQRERRSRRSAVVLVELRRPVPALAIRPVGRGLPQGWRAEGPGLEVPGYRSSDRFGVRGPDGGYVLREIPPRLRALMASGRRWLSTDGQTVVWTRIDAPAWPAVIERFLDEAQAAAEALEEEGGALLIGPSAPAAAPPPPFRELRPGRALAAIAIGAVGFLFLIAGSPAVVALYRDASGEGPAVTADAGFLVPALSGVAGAVMVGVATRVWRRG